VKHLLPRSAGAETFIRFLIAILAVAPHPSIDGHQSWRLHQRPRKCAGSAEPEQDVTPFQ
jgi:hypothetical protein